MGGREESESNYVAMTTVSCWARTGATGGSVGMGRSSVSFP